MNWLKGIIGGGIMLGGVLAVAWGLNFGLGAFGINLLAPVVNLVSANAIILAIAGFSLALLGLHSLKVIKQ